MPLTSHDINTALSKITYPGMSRSIVSFGFVKEVSVTDTVIHCQIIVTTQHDTIAQQIQSEVETVLRHLAGNRNIELDFQHRQPKTTAPQGIQTIPGVKHIIAVASGKGGVGKSTIAVNLALTFSRLGYSTALLDADIYGPSIPLMMGMTEPHTLDERQHIRPQRLHDISVISIGGIVRRSEAVIWRGPLVSGTLKQMITETNWGEQDILIIDLPPGTGDAQLTLVQTVQLDGAVIVTTPQTVAFMDVERAISMFNKVTVPIAGLIINMTAYICPHCGKESLLYPTSSIEQYSEKNSIPILATLPFDPHCAAAGDEGIPIVLHDHSPLTELYQTAAQSLIKSIMHHSNN